MTLCHLTWNYCKVKFAVIQKQSQIEHMFI